MTRYKVKWTDFAIRSLAEIHAYITEMAKSEIPADKFILKLTDRGESLATLPFIGQIEPHLEESHLGGRYLVEGEYKIIYRVVEDRVEIIDVFHTKQNPIKITKRAKRKR